MEIFYFKMLITFIHVKQLLILILNAQQLVKLCIKENLEHLQLLDVNYKHL
jgi:hypothetical protein